MKRIQFLITIILLFACTPKITAQVYRFKASSVSVMEKEFKGKWGKWSDFKKAELIITLDGKKDRIIVHSKDMQLLKIQSYGEKVSTKYDDTVPFYCIDNDGESCTVLIVTRKNQNNRIQIYLNYDKVRLVYNVYSYN